MNVLRYKTITHSRSELKKKNFFLRIKLLFVLLVLGMVTYIINNDQAYLEKLDDSQINGFALIGNNQFTSYEDIKDKLLKMGTLKGFWGQDIDEIKEQIVTIPWVKNAVIRKIWPDRLSIWITEYEPVALWNETSAVSKEGIVFKLPLDKIETDSLPKLFGPDYQSLLVLETWEHIYNYLKKQDIILKKLSIDNRGAWEATLDNGVTLILGRGDWVRKLETFSTVYPQIEVPENKKLSYIDLRYGVGAAIGLVDAN